MPNNYPNGVGATLGDTLATCKPLLVNSGGAIWYVAGAGGTDAASPAGQNREKPLATIQQAITNSSSGDIIVLLSSCSLVLATVVNLGGRVLIGEGGLTSLPTATVGFDGANGELRLDAAGSRVGGIKFTGRTGALAVVRITISASNCEMRNCTMDCGANDTAAGVLLGAAISGTRIENCTFTSTGTVVTAQPESAVKSNNAQTDMLLRNVTFDAGTVGFSNYYALDLSNGVHVRLRADGISMLRGADVTLNTSTSGSFNPQLSTGGSRLVW